MELVGATAIEDKLQDEVGETIATLKKAGMTHYLITIKNIFIFLINNNFQIVNYA